MFSVIRNIGTANLLFLTIVKSYIIRKITKFSDITDTNQYSYSQESWPCCLVKSLKLFEVLKLLCCCCFCLA